MKKKYPKVISAYTIYKGQSFNKPDDRMIVYSEEEKQSFIEMHKGQHIKMSSPKWSELEGNIVKKLWYIFPEWVFVIIIAVISILSKELLSWAIKKYL